jgi:hypothetical protein
MRVHAEHFEPDESGRNKVIVVGETEPMVEMPEHWDIYIFSNLRSHLKYFNECIVRELENPKVIAAGDLVPRTALPDSKQSIFIHAGSMDNAGMTENGLGIEPTLFEAWRTQIEDAINETIVKIKANADRTSSPGR